MLCAIVTGSSSGIGRAVAQRLASDGFAVLLADVRRDPLTGGDQPPRPVHAVPGGHTKVALNIAARYARMTNGSRISVCAVQYGPARNPRSGPSPGIRRSHS